MTTGQVPFEGSTLVSILNKHQNETLPWPAKIKRDLSENICRLIATMMAKDPADRYSDPGELLVDVDLVLQGRPPAHALPAPGSTSISLDETAYIAPPVRRVLRVKPKEAPGPPDAAEPPRAVEIPLIEPAPPEAIEPFSGNVGRPLPARPARRSSCLGIIVKAALAAVIAGAIAYAMFPARMKERVKTRARSAWRALGERLGPSAPG